MERFTYNPFYTLVYRYGNILITLMFIIHLAMLLPTVQLILADILPIIVYGLILFIVNRHYIKGYKIYPSTIELNNEIMLCKGFVIGEDLEINLSDIKEIKGNVFSGNSGKPLIIITADDKKIGIYPYIKNFNKLLTILLSNVKEDLYKELLSKIKKEDKKKPE